MPELEVKTIPSLLSGTPEWERAVEAEKRRRDALTPEQRAAEDELMRRLDEVIIDGTGDAQ